MPDRAQPRAKWRSRGRRRDKTGIRRPFIRGPRLALHRAPDSRAKIEVMGVPSTKRFAIRRRLGEGGMGVVYEAFDKERRARVALKTLNRFDGDALTRFKREFRALQGLAHPNLVALGELFFESDEWFFTMELLDGVDFVSHVRRTPPRTAYQSTIRANLEKLPWESTAAETDPP